MPRIRVESVSKLFGEIVALDKVDLEVSDGEYVSILGPSGCGKTTLIKIIAGIWQPTTGRILVDGNDVTRRPIEDRNLGYVFQNIVLFPHMTVKDNAGYGPKVKALEKKDVEKTTREALELVGMLEQQGFLPGELSGGAQQKAALARAIANKAKLLLLDEPLSALDARVRVELRYSLRRLVDELGLTAIHVTHDQEEALSVADRTILMRKGSIVESGKPRQLYERPHELFTANFVGESNFLEARVATVDDGMANVELRGQYMIDVKEGSLKAGEPVVVTVRPEYLSFREQEEHNTIKGRVEEARFMGSSMRYSLTLDNGEKLTVDRPLREQPHETGEEARVYFSPDRMIVYPRPVEGLQEVLRLD